MKAIELSNRRLLIATDAFADIVIWQLPSPVRGSLHSYKYRLAYVVADTCVLRYDNETGKGDHRHIGTVESAYVFTSIPTLLADFHADIERWNHENGRT